MLPRARDISCKEIFVVRHQRGLCLCRGGAGKSSREVLRRRRFSPDLPLPLLLHALEHETRLRCGRVWRSWVRSEWFAVDTHAGPVTVDLRSAYRQLPGRSSRVGPEELECRLEIQRPM